MLSPDQNVKITIFFFGWITQIEIAVMNQAEMGKELKSRVILHGTWVIGMWINTSILLEVSFEFLALLFKKTFLNDQHLCYLKITQKTVQRFISSKIKYDDKQNNNNSHLVNLETICYDLAKKAE